MTGAQVFLRTVPGVGRSLTKLTWTRGLCSHLCQTQGLPRIREDQDISLTHLSHLHKGFTTTIAALLQGCILSPCIALDHSSRLSTGHPTVPRPPLNTSSAQPREL